MRPVLSPQEDVVDLLPDEGPQPQELPVDPMQDGLQEVPLPRVLAVKQLQQLQMETRTDGVFFGLSRYILISIAMEKKTKNKKNLWGAQTLKQLCGQM